MMTSMERLGSAIQRAPGVVATVWFSLASIIFPIVVMITMEEMRSRVLVVILAGLGLLGGIGGATIGRRILKPEATPTPEKATTFGIEVLFMAYGIVVGLIIAYDMADMVSGGELRSIYSLSRTVRHWVIMIMAVPAVIGALAGWFLFEIRKKYVDPPLPDEAS